MQADSCIGVYAYPLRKNEANPEYLEIEVVVGFRGLLGRKVQVRDKRPQVFLKPRGDFLSPDRDDQRAILSTIIRGIETPFPLQDIYWTLGKFPQESDPTYTIDELVATRLTDISRTCSRNAETTTMVIVLAKHEKVDTISCCPFLIREPLGDWILEHPGVEAGTEPECLETILGLRMFWDAYCRVRAVKIGKEAAEKECSICLEDLEKGKYEISMPCSHVFHGYCILEWIRYSPTCPFCRVSLLDEPDVPEQHP